MDAEPQRWAASYTKHLKQKRKAYHDGTLLLQPDSGRLVLLDDAGDTLESRFLRASEEVSTGAALSFHSYLVDVGDTEDCPAGSRSSSSSAAATSRTAHRGGARGRPASAAGRLNRSVPRAFVNLPNSRGVVDGREGKAAGSGGANEAGSGFQEWTALYTSQLTQKAKKYHDGVVRLVRAGSHVKQIVLLDEDGQVLGSRHLNSGETIESGKKCIFRNYLIEICEAKNEKEGIDTSEEPIVQTGAKSSGITSNKMGLCSVSKSQKFINPQNVHVLEKKSEVTASSGKPETGNSEMVASGSLGSSMGTASCFKEWNALYTTQITQKAKKYHDGVLRLVVGSHSRQIILLDEDSGVLGSRYLKSVESIECGTKCQIPNYLIEVSELRNQKNEGKSLEVSQTGQKSEANDETGAKNARKRNCGSTSNRPLVGKTACNNMNSHDIHRGTSTNSVWPEVGKSWSSNVGDPLQFDDPQDGKSRCSTNFMRKEVGNSTFGNMDNSIRTASQILSIMKPPSEIKPPQCARSFVPSSHSRTPVDASHTNNLVVDDSNRTFAGRGHSGLSHFATQLRTSVQSCLILDASHKKDLVVDDLRKTFDGSGHSGFTHCATQLRTAVKSCLSLETLQQNNLVMAHQWNESSRNSNQTQDIMRPAAFESQDLAVVDILASDISNAKEQKLNSSDHLVGSSNDNVSSDRGLQDDDSGTSLSTKSSIVGRKCDGSLSTSYTLTSKDPKIQELIDDCPSFDLGF